jgi:hypothetical protein
MTENQILSLLALMGCLALVSLNFRSHRIGLSSGVKMAVIWVLIFAVAAAVAGLIMGE